MAGGIFISSREMASGPNDEYSNTAQNASGVLVRLRVHDGVHFTGDGYRFLARLVLAAPRSDPVTVPIFSVAEGRCDVDSGFPLSLEAARPDR